MKKHISTIFYEFVEEHGYTVEEIKVLTFSLYCDVWFFVKDEIDWQTLCKSDFIERTMKLKKVEFEFYKKYQVENNNFLWIEFLKYAIGLTFDDLGEEPAYE